MAASRDKSFSSIALETVGWPMMWGMLACTLFYFLIHQGIIESPTVERYFSGHPVEYVETALFFIGVAAIVGKLSGVSLQLSSVQDMQLPPKPAGGQRTADAGAMLKAMEEIPKYLRNSVLGRTARSRAAVRPPQGNRAGTGPGTEAPVRCRRRATTRIVCLGADHHLGDSDAGIPGNRDRHHAGHRRSLAASTRRFTRHGHGRTAGRDWPWRLTRRRWPWCFPSC